MPGSARLVLTRRRGQIIAVTGLTVVSAAYLAAPNGWGGIAFFATATFGLISFGIGPLVHRPVNKGPWRWLMAAGVLFLVGLLIRLGLVATPGLMGRAICAPSAGTAARQCFWPACFAVRILGLT